MSSTKPTVFFISKEAIGTTLDFSNKTMTISRNTLTVT